MGMFDTLLIPFENETLELQSKRFDRILQTYTQGDVVSGAGSGIQIFFDEVDFDDTGKQCNHNSPSSGTLTVFIILVDSVFLDSVLIECALFAIRESRRLRNEPEQETRIFN